MNQEELNAFNPEQPVTLSEMNEKIKTLKELSDKSKQLSDEKKLIDNAYETLESEIIIALQSNNLKSYKLDGVAALTVVNKMSVQTPKDLESKRAFKEWLTKRFGPDAVDAYLSINSNTLNSLYREEYELAILAGNADSFKISGICEPIARQSLSVRKA
jgi:hypothetical protein